MGDSRTEILDVGALPRRGVKVLRHLRGTPDADGVLKRFELLLPPLRRGCYFSADGLDVTRWPAFANRVLPWTFKRNVKHLVSKRYPPRPSVREMSRLGGLFALAELTDGRYLAILPMAAARTMSWLLVTDDGRLELHLGTLGTEPVACDAPLLAWAFADDVYAACRQAWGRALACKEAAATTTWREGKRYPEVFRYLGWCSWEEYKARIGEKVLVDAVRALERSGLPIRYVLVDDGHVEHEDRRLVSFRPNAKFPRGWRPLLRLRRKDRVRWMGVWNAFTGYWDTIAAASRLPPKVRARLAELPSGAILPASSRAAARAFYDAYVGAIRRHGFDFAKIDAQATLLRFYRGCDNAVEAATNCSKALEAAAGRELRGLINCMAHNPVCVFHTKHSAVTRCSIDYHVGRADAAKSHLQQSYHNTLWLGQTVWGDHDMFHSCDPASGRMMAVSKALSGGPVYLSDAPGDVVGELVRPLCYEDGELLRPLAPAAPLPDSVFTDPLNESVPYRVIAPLAGGAAAVAVYSLRHPPPKRALRSAVTPADYAHAGGMMQPYAGRWRVPREGLVVYDWYARAAARLEARYPFALDGFADRLLLLLPVRKGWAVVGRTDKYLSPAAVEVLSVTTSRLKLRLRESGPLAVWSRRGEPRARGIEFTDAGGGLYTADVPVEPRRRTVTVTRPQRTRAGRKEPT